MKRLALLIPLILATPAAAQQAASATPGFAVGAAKGMWQTMTNYVTIAAEQMPESEYGFRPVASVRTFGQQIAHVAGAQNMMCAAALGEKPGAEDEIEKTVTTKAGLVAALKASTQYCERAYAQADAATVSPVSLFGMTMPRLNVLVLNATHNAEHYGNIVTYMRIKGMTPPSSQPAPPRT
jgi:uncharacterized damage-inducible protein DinB